MFGFMIQVKAPGYEEAIRRLPPGTAVVAFEVQILRQIRDLNPRLFNIHRHWYDDRQIFGTTNPGLLRDRARTFIDSWLDGTFRQPGHLSAVDAGQGWNEYNANYHSPGQVAERVAWVEALCDVWTSEYQSQSDLDHLRLICGNVAVGNDLPIGAARAIYQTGQYAGYHAYIPYRKPSAAESVMGLGRSHLRPDRTLNAVSETFRGEGRYYLSPTVHNAPGGGNMPRLSRTERPLSGPSGVLPGEWASLSGRWATMDARFRQEGIRLTWMITEIGSVLYGQGGSYLDPYAGWRHPLVHDGDIEEYLRVLKYWNDQTRLWNQAHGNRCRGPVLFVSKPHDNGDQWRTWIIQQPEMNRIADKVAEWHTQTPTSPPPTPPPPPTPDPLPPTPEPEDGCRGRPREQYHRVYHLIDPSVPDHLTDPVYREAEKTNGTVGWSFDDAGIGDLDKRTVRIYGAPENRRTVYTGWFADHYPGAAVEFRDLPHHRELHLPVIPLSQRDSRWAHVPLGEQTGHNRTIGSWGCLLVSYCMMANYLGLGEWNPEEFNRHFIQAGAMSGASTDNGALKTAFPDRVEYQGYVLRDDPHLVMRVLESLDRGIPVPVEVDFIPRTSPRDQHWVLIIGHNGTDWIMADPWYGDIAPLTRYDIDGEDIIQAVIYTLK